jgi:hypothetical protein
MRHYKLLTGLLSSLVLVGAGCATETEDVDEELVTGGDDCDCDDGDHDDDCENDDDDDDDDDDGDDDDGDCDDGAGCDHELELCDDAELQASVVLHVTALGVALDSDCGVDLDATLSAHVTAMARFDDEHETWVIVDVDETTLHFTTDEGCECTDVVIDAMASIDADASLTCGGDELTAHASLDVDAAVSIDLGDGGLDADDLIGLEVDLDFD